MDVTSDDRLRSVVLFGAAVAVLVVGAWWWRAAAPASTAGTAGPSAVVPSAGPSVSTPIERFILPEEPDERVTIRMDPNTGEVLRVRSGSRVVLDPATGSITDIEGDPAVLFPAGDLPSFQETIWREERELAPGQGLTRQAGDDGGGRYLLQYRCTRPGTMAVTSTGAEIVGQPRIDCDGTVANAEVLPGGGPFRVSLSAVDRPIDIQAQLVALPR
ncbi:hypothetical protein [Micromonospora sp. NPDC005171]|uniref:hypothetical protein n=1 Tax=Micromonospora sp. NPDC005171 TaxID=3156866 RepID=UPI0033A542B1